MEKYCQQCGNKLDEGERFCGACGAPVQAPQAVQQPVPSFASDNGQQITEPQQPAQEKKKMSKKKKWIIIGAAAGAVAVLAAVFFIFILPLFGGGNSSSLITFSEGGNDYYASPYLFKLNGDDVPEIVSDELGEKSIYFSDERSVKDGKMIYTVKSNVDREEAFLKYEFKSDKTMAESQWVSPDLVKSSPFSSSDDKNSNWVTAIYHLQKDGNYAYFTLIPTMEFAVEQGDIKGKMGRISLDGTKIEQVADINAEDFVIDGGWIYYYDDGYHTVPDLLVGRRDASVAGIYKIRPDGSGKKKLHGFTVMPDQLDSFEYGNGTVLCGDMQMIGGKLYFLDYSYEGQGRLCRMGKDGGNVEYISSRPVLYYAVDADHNVAYCGTMDNPIDYGYERNASTMNPTFAKYDLSSHQETDIPCPTAIMEGVGYQNGYLYFVSYVFGYGDGKAVGMRMNTSNNHFEWLIYHDESKMEWKVDPDTGKREFVSDGGKKYLTWETVEIKKF